MPQSAGFPRRSTSWETPIATGRALKRIYHWRSAGGPKLSSSASCARQNPFPNFADKHFCPINSIAEERMHTKASHSIAINSGLTTRMSAGTTLVNPWASPYLKIANHPMESLFCLPRPSH